MADVIVFGALDPCDKCKNGNFIFGNSAYVCTGNLSEWAKCDNIQTEPKRRAVSIPSAIKKSCPFLDKKFKSKTRVVKYVAPLRLKPEKKEEGADDIDAYVDRRNYFCVKTKILFHSNIDSRPRIQREKPPLYNMEFVIIGPTQKDKDEIKKTIQRMGGKLGTKIHEKVAAIISTEADVKRMGSRMHEAKDFGIQVVPEDILEDVKKGGAVSFIISKSMCDWGTDVSRTQSNTFALSH